MELIEDCPDCVGTGVIIADHDEAWVQYGCRTCLGTGWLETALSPEEAQKRRLKRISRGILVIVLTAVPTLLFVFMIL